MKETISDTSGKSIQMVWRNDTERAPWKTEPTSERAPRRFSVSRQVWESVGLPAMWLLRLRHYGARRHGHMVRIPRPERELTSKWGE